MDFIKCIVSLSMMLLLALIQAGNCIGDMTTQEIKLAVAKAFYEDLKELQKEASTTKRGLRTSRSREFGYFQRPKYHGRLFFNDKFALKPFRNNEVDTKMLIRSALNKGKEMKRYDALYLYRRRTPVVDMVSPTMKRKLRLINRLDQAITVHGDVISGTNRIYTAETRLQLESVGYGSIMIKGLDANRYICMDRITGYVDARAKKSLECVFNERMEANHYTTYQAFLHRKSKRRWYLAVNAHGKVVNGWKGKMDSKKSQFNRI